MAVVVDEVVFDVVTAVVVAVVDVVVVDDVAVFPLHPMAVKISPVITRSTRMFLNNLLCIFPPFLLF